MAIGLFCHREPLLPQEYRTFSQAGEDDVSFGKYGSSYLHPAQATKAKFPTEQLKPLIEWRATQKLTYLIPINAANRSSMNIYILRSPLVVLLVPHQ